MSPIVWHGSPARFAVFEHRDVLTRLYAHWASADPVIAALYAGPGGHVYPVSAAPGVRMLDAGGFPGVAPLHFLEDEQLSAVREAYGSLRDDQEVLGSADEVFGLECRLLGLPRVPDRSCWEGVVDEIDMDGEDTNAILRRLGFQAVLSWERGGATAGDLERRFGRANAIWSTATQRLAASLRRPTGGELAIAFLSPEAPVVAGQAILADDLVSRYLTADRPLVTSRRALEAACRPPEDVFRDRSSVEPPGRGP